MATVKAPLMSLDASGTIGKAIVFAKWKGINYVRRHAIPANPRSVGQLSVRAMMRFLSQQWDGLSSAEKTTWDDRAAAAGDSPFNRYVSINMSRWGTNLRPYKREDAEEDDTAGVIDTESATAGSRSALVSITVSTLNQNWGINIFRGTTAVMGVTRNELVRTIVADAAQAYTWLDFPLTPNVAVYYRAYPFSEEGVVGGALDDFTCTPTV